MTTTAFSGQWGTAGGGEPVQSLAAADGWKTLIPYQVFVDTDTIDGGSGVFTVPATGIYQIKGMFGLTGSTAPGLWYSRILANGATTLAEGFNPSSTGTDYGSPIAQYFGCLEAGTTIEFQGNNPGVSASNVYGNVALLRIPQPFTVLELDTGDVDQPIVWQPICDRESWWDAGDPTKLTVTETGYYLLSHKDDWTGTFTGDWWRISRIYVNGVSVNEGVGYPGPGDPTPPQWNMPISTVLSLTAGDYVEIFNDDQVGATPGVDLLTSADLGMCKIPGTFCGAHVYKSGQVAVFASQRVDFDTVIYDTDGFFSIGTPDVLTIPSGKAGKYIVWGNDLKPGLRNVRSYIGAVSAGSPFDSVVTGIDSAALANYGSSPHFAIWDLAVGDQVVMGIQNSDVGGTQEDLNMGLAKIDGWTYPIQENCPCPSIVVPPNLVSMYLMFDQT